MAAKKGKDGKSVSTLVYEEKRQHCFDVEKKRPRRSEVKLTREETPGELKAIYKKEVERIKKLCETNNTRPINIKKNILLRGMIMRVSYDEVY